MSTIKEKKIVFCDICNTIADINGQLVKRGYEKLEEFYPAPIPARVWEDHSIYRDANPINQVLDLVRELSSQANTELIYLTARHKSALPITWLWLLRNAAPLGKLMASHGEAKGSIIGRVMQERKAQEFILIDDAPREISSTWEMISNSSIKGQVLVPSYQYNSHLPGRRLAVV
jgi:hypothetical protein